MSDKIHLKITTPERVVMADDVDEVVLPTAMGEIGILPHHIPLVALLAPGEIRVKKDNTESFLAVSGGFIEVQPKRVIVLADTAEHAHEIDEQRAEEARKRAEELRKTKRVDATDFALVAANLEKELARLRVVRKHRSRKGHSNE
ncbi:MAG: F0F1 ATP synthase subunit epsilon [Patescibacteria group bacterium]|jgi:F-type H+-transporting ATPase subunit epsilon